MNLPRLTRVMLVALLAVVALNAAAADQGVRLRQLLVELEQSGLQIVYSTSLIDDAMVVDVDRASSSREQLHHALAQVGLKADLVGGTYYIARDPSAAEPSVVLIAPIQYLEEITVSPGKVRLESKIPAERQLLTESYFESAPHPADDLMHAVKALPSISDQDASGGFNVRGGAEDELLIHLDGQEIFEPYHLKDFLNLFSSLDTEVIEMVDVFAGGFPVEYGDRMSGVLDISLSTPSERRVEVGIGTINSRLLLGDVFGEGGSWLISGRAWYPEALPDSVGLISNRTVKADFADALFRVTHPVGSRHEAYAGSLVAYDDLDYIVSDIDESEKIGAEYGSEQVWVGAVSSWSSMLTSQTSLSWAHISRERQGDRTSDEDGDLLVSDRRNLRSLSLRSEWNWLPTDQHLVKFGYEGRSQEAGYDYSRFQIDAEGEEVEDLDLTLDPDGTFNAVWVSDRVALRDNVVAELGLRWDSQTHLDQTQLSPRANILWGVGPRTDLRLGWGKYYQAERLNELSISDGELDFYRPQASEQWLSSVNHFFRSGHKLRVSGWYKRFDRLRPRWENLLNPLELFPEAETDRALLEPEQATASGVELMVSSAAAVESHSWWLGYSYADAADLIDGEKVPRRWDRRHSFDAVADVRLPWRLRAGLGFTWQSGKPATGAIVVVDDEGQLDYELSPIFGERLGSYKRLDLRLSRSFDTRWGSAELLLEVFNLTNQENECCIDDYEIVGEDPATAVARPDVLRWVSFVPSLFLSMEF